MLNVMLRCHLLVAKEAVRFASGVAVKSWSVRCMSCMRFRYFGV
jgi:hypothetical protein